ncbi:MAG: RNA polymerase sigma factor [Bacteroidetes bacterium]|nr:RNA polymerase sigma factor [Bacteroidota bacterium]
MQPSIHSTVFILKKNELISGFSNIHQDLIDRSLKGDGIAQSKLYGLYSKAMYNVCLRITNNEDDTKDVMQEAFISAFQNLGSYKGEASFGAWLKRIVVNKAINHIKRKRVEFTELNPERDEMQEEQPDLTNEQELTVEKIKNAIVKLPDGYRLVFSLYLLEGYDHQEIAGILNISESTSKSQYNRAKKKLRELIE